MMADALLQVRGVYAGYGRGDIIHGIDLEAREGEIATIIGPNGAGKSTAIKAIAGLVRMREGSIRVNGDEIGGLAASVVAQRGVAFVPQDANVFRQLTVIENLQMGAWLDREHYQERLDRVHRLFPILKERAAVRAGNLSGGERQMVAFGMALMVKPKVLLLDEPSAGLSPAMVQQMFETIKTVNRSGIAVLMVEQNAIQALRISQRGYVMAAGQIAMDDDAEALLNSAEVSELYLGSRE
jgi:branched-chain amino acid transport system ATP-binding protein/neutral amino acid transport system ATP-binding protein